jgi:hypothetical protein
VSPTQWQVKGLMVMVMSGRHCEMRQVIIGKRQFKLLIDPGDFVN